MSQLLVSLRKSGPDQYDRFLTKTEGNKPLEAQYAAFLADWTLPQWQGGTNWRTKYTRFETNTLKHVWGLINHDIVLSESPSTQRFHRRGSIPKDF